MSSNQNIFNPVTITQAMWGVYEVLRRASVELGLYPDLNVNPPLTPTQVESEIELIRQNGGYPVRVVPFTPIQNQGSWDYGTLFLNLVDISKGTVGTGNTFRYDSAGTGFTRSDYNDYTHDLNIMLTSISPDVFYIEVFQTLIAQALGFGINRLQAWDVVSKDFIEDTAFELCYLDTQNVTINELFEFKYMFSIKNIYLAQFNTATNVPTISTIEREIIQLKTNEDI